MNQSSPRSVVAKCPVCGTWGAKKSLFKVKCVNPSCRKYDSEYAGVFQQNRIVGKLTSEVFHLSGTASPEEHSLRIRYKNFRGDEMIYAANPATGYTNAEFLMIRVAPSGRRIAFRLSSIQNRSEVESQIPAGPRPSPIERRILNYHVRKGTTSPRFKQIHEKYPDYQP